MAKFTGRKIKCQIQYEGASFDKYPHRLLLYKDPPVEEISLEEFEKFAVDRLRLLREVETINIRFKKGTDEYNNKMRDALQAFVPNDFKSSDYGDSVKEIKEEHIKIREAQTAADPKLRLILADRRRDHISHFILRLAFSRTEDLRRWFLVQEMDLFRYRFQNESSNEVDIFLKGNQIHFQALSDAEKTDDLVQKLTDSMFNAQASVVRGTLFYKVPFTDVLDLVRNRRVYLHKGLAYVPRQELVSIIISLYRSRLSQALTVMSRKLPYLEEDTRLLPILKNLSSAYIGDSYMSKKATAGSKLELNEIDETARISFPLCMRNLHEGLRQHHHLKHFGRLQYGLFLKATGLTLEEALLFWRTEFTRNMDVDKFEKQYAYNIRHSFGKEGKRADYTPYSCMRIITSNQPGLGDLHGCPFKHSDTDVLQRRLQSYKINSDAIKEITDLVNAQHFQIACAKYFEVTHKLPENANVSINHPNQYFDESRRIAKGGIAASRFLLPAKDERSQVESSADANTSSTPTDLRMEIDDAGFGDEMAVEI